jgi:2-polyprenyl-3-methyl-5-hydroxy-6-metoxy-1,4-benzoquinol methylase
MSMPLPFWDYANIGRPQWRGQKDLARKLTWFILGAPDIHTRVRNTHVINVVERLPMPIDAKILDAGCGRAVALYYLTRRHPDWQLTGLELDDEMVDSCQKTASAGSYNNLKFIQTTINELSEETAYNLVLCIDVLEHIPDDVGLLRRIYHALVPGGYLVLHVPRRGSEQWRFWSGFHEHGVESHVREEYRQEELQQRFEQAGLTILELNQTFGRAAEIAFEINHAFERNWTLRQIIAILTHPLTLPLAYGDTRHYQKRGNSFLVLAQRT